MEFSVYLAYIIGFAAANRPAGDFRYYVSYKRNHIHSIKRY